MLIKLAKGEKTHNTPKPCECCKSPPGWHAFPPPRTEKTLCFHVAFQAFQTIWFDVLFSEYVLIQKPCRYFFSICKSIPLKLLVPWFVLTTGISSLRMKQPKKKIANTTRFSYYNLGAVSVSTVTSALALAHNELLARRNIETFGNHHDLEFVTSIQWIWKTTTQSKQCRFAKSSPTIMDLHCKNRGPFFGGVCLYSVCVCGMCVSEFGSHWSFRTAKPVRVQKFFSGVLKIYCLSWGKEPEMITTLARGGCGAVTKGVHRDRHF